MIGSIPIMRVKLNRRMIMKWIIVIFILVFVVASVSGCMFPIPNEIGYTQSVYPAYQPAPVYQTYQPQVVYTAPQVYAVPPVQYMMEPAYYVGMNYLLGYYNGCPPWYGYGGYHHYGNPYGGGRGSGPSGYHPRGRR
jgi:hypothetical protein